MPTFVHIADDRDATSIKRTGLKLPKKSPWQRDDFPSGVFAMPVVANFLLSHQWLRELKRRGFKTAIGVYFKLPDSELVWAGIYNQPKEKMKASEAAAQLNGMQDLGFEVIIPCSIPAASITAIRALPQHVGWRYFPGAHERGIFCGCSYCMRGQFRSRKIRERYEAGEL